MYKVPFTGNLESGYKEPPLYYEIEEFAMSLPKTGKSRFHFFDIPKERETELINCLFDGLNEKALIEKYGDNIKDILDYATIEYEMNGCFCKDITVYNKWGVYIVVRFY